METATLNADRLSIRYLLCLLAGVGVAISISCGIEQLRFPADAVYYGPDAVGDVDAFGMLVAAIYGVCVTTFIFAWRSGDVWSSPGKTLALLFASMGVLNWSLDLVSALVTAYRMREPFTRPRARRVGKGEHDRPKRKGLRDRSLTGAPVARRDEGADGGRSPVSPQMSDDGDEPAFPPASLAMTPLASTAIRAAGQIVRDVRD